MLRRFILLKDMRIFQETVPGSSLISRTEDVLDKGALVLTEEIGIKDYDRREKLVVPFEHAGQSGFLLIEELSPEARDYSGQWEHFHKEAKLGKGEYNKNEAARKRDDRRERLATLLRDVTRPYLRVVAGKDHHPK